MKKYEGSWKNHIKEGQKAAKETKTETKEELVIVKDINPFDGCGITRCKTNNIDELIEKLNREFAQSITNIKIL